MSATNFQKALEQLVTDVDYCRVVKDNPQRLISDHQLSEDELMAMRDIAVRVGWDVPLRRGDDDDDSDGDNNSINCCACCCCGQAEPTPNNPM
jgi:hypothetical protein